MASPPEAPPREDASAQTRAAAKWLIAAFAAVGAALLSGVSLAELGGLDGTRLWIAIGGAISGALGVLVAIMLITDVLAPSPVTLGRLATWERRRNDSAKGDRNDELVDYAEGDPSLLQGMVMTTTPKEQVLVKANESYREAVAGRYATSEGYWALADQKGTADAVVVDAQRKAEVANSRASTMHDTVRRLERLADEHQTVDRFREQRPALAVCAIFVAIGIGAFAAASNPPEPATADLGGANLRHVDLSGASLRGADLSNLRLKDTNLYGTNLDGADIEGTTWKNTICPDGTNSDDAGDSCDGHLSPPPFRPDPLR